MSTVEGTQGQTEERRSSSGREGVPSGGDVEQARSSHPTHSVSNEASQAGTTPRLEEHEESKVEVLSRSSDQSSQVGDQPQIKYALLEEGKEELWEHSEGGGLKGVLKTMGLVPQEERPLEERKAIEKAMQELRGVPDAESADPGLRFFVQHNQIQGTREERLAAIRRLGQTLRPVAKVVAITASPLREQEHIVTLAELEGRKKSLLYALPTNGRLPWFCVEEAPKEYIEDKKSKTRNPNHRYYTAKFQSWSQSERSAKVVITGCIGEAGNLVVECLRILKKHQVCTDLYEHGDGEEAHEDLRRFVRELHPVTGEWPIPEEEVKKRLDLRKKRVFSIDPITARDLDDALSIERITDTIYEIGVHIADVSYFLPYNSTLDREALRRGTSTYFVHKVYPMLPRLLCERLCSLNAGVDRLTYSIFFRMDLAKGEVDRSFEPRIQRSIINSCAKWNYDLVQKILDGSVHSEDQLEPEVKPNQHSFLDVAQDVLKMNAIAQARRKKRLASGSLEFISRDFNFTLDKDTFYPLHFAESPKMQSK